MTEQVLSERLANGLTLAVEPMPHVRSASWTLLLEAGSAGDPAGQSGAAQLLGGMVFRGAGDRNARELSDSLDALGVQRGAHVDQAYQTFSGACLAADLPAALAIYADIIRRPALPGEELDAERALALQSVAALNDNPVQRLFAELTQIYFPGPFGRPVLGTVDDLQQIDLTHLQRDYRARFKPGGAILAVAGGVDFDHVRTLATQLFGDWDGSPPATPQAIGRSDASYTHLQQDTAQTQIGVAYASVPLEHPDYYLSRLVLTILSGSMGARLYTEVREKRGLVYSVAAIPRLHRGTGAVLGYAGTQPARAQETVDVLLGELQRITAGVTADELERARTGLLSALVMQGESSGARAGAIAGDIHLLGRPRTLDEIRAAVDPITLDALNSYLRTLPAPAFTVVTLGPTPVDVPAQAR